MKNNIQKRGQVLVEVVVSLSVLAVGFLGLFSLLSQSFSLIRTVTDSYRATYLAAEGIEVIKNIIDSNVLQGSAWNAGPAGSLRGDYEIEYNSITPSPLSASPSKLCLENATGLYGYHVPCSSPDFIESPFTRVVRINEVDIDGVPGVDKLVVVSEVAWNMRGGGGRTVILEDHFYAWQ